MMGGYGYDVGFDPARNHPDTDPPGDDLLEVCFAFLDEHYSVLSQRQAERRLVEEFSISPATATEVLDKYHEKEDEDV